MQRKQPTHENILKATQVPTIMISHLPLHLHEISNQCCPACFCGIQKPWFNVSFKSAQSFVPISHFKRRMGFRISLKTRQDTSWGRIGQDRAGWDKTCVTYLSIVPNSHLGSLLKGILIAWNLAIFSATSAEMLGSLNSQVSSLRLCQQGIRNYY